MNKWYRSAPVKGALLLIQQVLVVLAVVGLAWLSAYPGLAQDIVSGSEGGYSQSEGFGQRVYWDSQNIISAVADKDGLETDGKLDETKLVDIKEMCETGTITGENINGLAYTIGELSDWGKRIESGNVSVTDNAAYNNAYNGTQNVIVCQKPDGTYDYYYYDDFKSRIEAGELSFMTKSDDTTTSEDILSYLESGSLYQEDGMGTVVDGNNQVIYRNIWNYDGYWLEEAYAPDGAETILDIANSDPRWNGKLSEAFSEIDTAVNMISSKMGNYTSITDTWEEGNTNLTYLYADTNAKKVYTNRAEFADYNKLEQSIDTLKKEGSYTVVRPTLAEFESNMNGIEGDEWRHTVQEMGPGGEDFVYAVGIDTAYPVQDAYYNQNQMYETYAPSIQGVIVMGVLAVIGILAILVWLTLVAGRSTRDEEIHLNVFDRIKTELAAALTLGAWLLLCYLATNMYGPFRGAVYEGDYYYTDMFQINIGDVVLVSGMAVVTCVMFMVGYLSLVRRIKAKTLWKNSILKWLCGFVRKVAEHISEVWRIVLALLGVLFLHFLVLESGGSVFLFVLLMLAVDVLVAVYMIRQVIGRNRLGEGISRIAAGEVDYKIPLEGLRGGQRDVAEKINTIGEGLDAAVEASMKNERLKTDLITNVSHDIKTPLTSIINYVDLLKRENLTDLKIQGYLDVLEAKAQRLKTLTEDVVEASKVSSGNISLEYMNINLVEMIQQTSGEFEEKFSARSLKEVLTLPEQEAIIHVDGRRMWRVLENIYNNAAKYAMEGTRIYADLTVSEKTVTFNLKNVSEQPLNIDADELTERFIRGDVSRSTEGSGLGLSIAKSLTEMQGGTFDLYLDGDLFKVTITFPRVTKEEHAAESRAGQTE